MGEKTMYKLFLFLFLSFIFFSANDYAYAENYDIKKKVYMSDDNTDYKYINFLCTFESKDNNNFHIELTKKYPLKSPLRECDCQKDKSNLFKTFYSCDCHGNVPLRKYYFEWRALGSNEMTCNHFINKLYTNDYYYIDENMIVGPTF